MSTPATEFQKVRTEEQELAESLRHQTQAFTTALEVIDRINDRENLEDPGSISAVSQLQRSLEQVNKAQNRVNLARVRNEKIGQGLSSGLRKELEQQEVLMRRLLDRIAFIEKKFEAARSVLIPQLDEETRRHNMRTAYQKSLRTV